MALDVAVNGIGEHRGYRSKHDGGGKWPDQQITAISHRQQQDNNEGTKQMAALHVRSYSPQNERSRTNLRANSCDQGASSTKKTCILHETKLCQYCPDQSSHWCDESTLPPHPYHSFSTLWSRTSKSRALCAPSPSGSS